MAFMIGALAKRSGLCMVKGVSALMAGRPALLSAILVCGLTFWFLIPFSINPRNTFALPQYGASLLFFIGGLLFGLGAGFNQGCSVSTLTRLAQRDIRMLATVFGWAAGWLIFSNVSLDLSISYQLLTMCNFSVDIHTLRHYFYYVCYSPAATNFSDYFIIWCDQHPADSNESRVVT